MGLKFAAGRLFKPELHKTLYIHDLNQCCKQIFKNVHIWSDTSVTYNIPHSDDATLLGACSCFPITAVPILEKNGNLEE